MLSQSFLRSTKDVLVVLAELLERKNENQDDTQRNILVEVYFLKAKKNQYCIIMDIINANIIQSGIFRKFNSSNITTGNLA